MKNLRVQPYSYPFKIWSTTQNFLRGPIAFDYGARTITCGQGLDELEAYLVADELRAELRLSE
jgi:hypothetical protein